MLNMPASRSRFFDLTQTVLREQVVSWGLPPYRADQMFDWVYRKNVADPAAMTNLSAVDRDKIAHELTFLTSRIAAHHRAGDGTQKLLLDWTAGPTAGQSECVMIPVESRSSHAPTPGNTPANARARRTACVSSQVGCPVGCRFCASGLGGLEGNLSAGQIVEQVWRLNQLAGDDPGQRITHVVFMGMGEPLANFDAVVQAVGTLCADWGLGLSARRITISTVGLPAQIRRLADWDTPVTLALSLHAPNDELRKQIIPWAQFVSIKQLLEAGRYYFQRSGREITLEYILLGGVNDQAEHARQLAGLAKQLRSNVNLIRYNEVRGLPYQRPATENVHRFQRILHDAGVNVHIRASRGRDIAAACGQLRHEHAR